MWEITKLAPYDIKTMKKIIDLGGGNRLFVESIELNDGSKYFTMEVDGNAMTYTINSDEFKQIVADLEDVRDA